MTKRETFKLWLRSLHPSLWVMSYRYSAVVDRLFRDALDNGCRFIMKGRHYAGFGPLPRVWVCNYPYACFTVDIGPVSQKLRPSRMTILRLKDRLEESIEVSL